VIVKDSRSPRGRHEIQPRQGDALRGMRPIGEIGDGRTWRETMGSIFIPREPRRPPGPRAPLPRIQVVGECGHIFLTAHATIARYCSGACRQRACQARKRAA
jgi:hypothetical protein